MKSEHAQAATLLRKELKKILGKERVISCRSDSYAGGTAVRANVLDVTPEERAQLRTLEHKFSYGSFDGMTDCYDYDNRQEHPQVKFVFIQASFSEAMKEKAARYLSDNWGEGFEKATITLDGSPETQSSLIRHVLYANSPIFDEFWTREA